jgi:LPXTG-motif cell wall-anchored protein
MPRTLLPGADITAGCQDPNYRLNPRDFAKESPGTKPWWIKVYGPGLAHIQAAGGPGSEVSQTQGGFMRMTRQNRTRSAVIAGAGIAALAGAGILAAPASAHTGVWSVTCDSVSVHLTKYNPGATNSVTLSVDGGAVLASRASFGGGYDFAGPLPAHTTALTLHLVVRAGDGTQYNVDERKTAALCEKPPTTPPTTSPSTPPPTTPTTVPPTTVPPTTTPAPTTVPPTATTSAPVAAGTTSAPAGGNLAATGSSSATPVIAGIAVAAVVVGGGAIVLSRRRRSSSHR